MENKLKTISFGLFLARIIQADKSSVTGNGGQKFVANQTQAMPIMSPYGACKQFEITGLKFAPLQRSFLENPAPGVKGIVSWYDENRERQEERGTIVGVIRDKTGVTGFLVENAAGEQGEFGKNQWKSLNLKTVEGAFQGQPGIYLVEFKVSARSTSPADIAEAIRNHKYTVEPVQWLCPDFDDRLVGATNVAKEMQRLYATSRIRPGDSFEVSIEGLKGKSVVECVEIDTLNDALIYSLKGEEISVARSEAQMIRYKPAHLLREKDVTTIPTSKLNMFELQALEDNDIEIGETVEYAVIQQINNAALSEPYYSVEEFFALASELTKK